jgi:hypothetical protein
VILDPKEEGAKTQVMGFRADESVPNSNVPNMQPKIKRQEMGLAKEAAEDVDDDGEVVQRMREESWCAEAQGWSLVERKLMDFEVEKGEETVKYQKRSQKAEYV